MLPDILGSGALNPKTLNAAFGHGHWPGSGECVRKDRDGWV